MTRLLRRSLGRTVIPLLLLGAVLALACADVRAVTEAGTIISNRADVAWVDALTGETSSARSNASSVEVAAVRRFAIDGTREATARAGTVLDFAYRVLNSGNVADRYRLSPVDLGGDAGALDGLAVHHDLNGNGVLDAGEPSIEETPSLAPGEVISLVVAVVVPEVAIVGERYAIELRAGDADGAARAVTTTIAIVDGASLAIDRTTDLDCAVELPAGEDVSHRLEVVNRESELPLARAHRVDGEVRSGVLLVDRVPSGLQLSPARPPSVTPAETIALVQAEADGEDWTSVARWSGARPVDRVAVLMPADALAAGETVRFRYTLRAERTLAPGVAGSGVAGIDLDADGRDDVSLDPPCAGTPVTEPGRDVGAASPAVSIAFVAPEPELRRTGAAPELSTDGDFVAAGSYALDSGRGGYEVLRDGLYIELRVTDIPEAAVFGDDGRGGTSIVVTLESLGTGDSLQVVLLESAPGSGVFRSVRPIVLGTAERGADRFCPGGGERPGDPLPDYTASAPECTLLSEPNDTQRVLFGDETLGVELIATATATVAPTAVVFDSSDLSPIPGATITFLQGEAGTVVVDPVGGEPVVRVSDERGVYDVPTLAPGEGYHVRVDPPEGWRFPSAIGPGALAGREVVASAYGAAGFDGSSGVFAVLPGGTTPLADIPLDPVVAETRLTLSKRALAVEIEPGGVVAYALEIGNAGEAPLADVRVADRLPYGFKLVAGTARIDGERAAEPDGAPGRALEFALGTLEPGVRLELGYVLEATAGAVDGDGTNVARASALTPAGERLRSAESRARVRIGRAGVLSDRAALFGKVYIDADCNDLQNDAEWPVGGVRLYLDDGTFAITDENGQYSLYGLAPGTHVVRADPISVPEGLRFKPLDNANAAAGDSRFAELSAGDFHRADFALSCPLENVEQVLAEIAERNADIDGTWLLEEAERFDPIESTTDRVDADRASLAGGIDIDGDLSNGILNGPDAGRTRRDRRVDEDEPGAEPDGTADGEAAPGAGAGRTLDPKEAVGDITAAQAEAGTWLWPARDTSLDGRFVAVVRAGIEPTLYVGDRPVPAAQIGERIENRRERAQIVAWYGVALEPGVNRVEVRGVDGFGNVRTLASGEFKRPATGTRMVLRARTDTLPADGGRSVLPIEILVLDDNDYPAQGVHFVTLETSETGKGAWLEEDLRPEEPGHQVRVDDGRATATLRSSEQTGTLLVRARADAMKADLRVFQVAALRPLFGVGLLEIGVVSNTLMGEGFAPSERADGFEDGTRAEGRLSMFLKGRVRGDAQLTLSYDSEKDGDTELLRDIDPGAHYPIHGDASVRGYEAQSRSKLYAKLEKGKSSVMWGDYVTDNDTDADDLARVQRVLTGFNARHDTGRARFELFAATSTEGRRVEEIPGNGTAMLFRLDGAPIVPNSELVELIVRDRENPGLVISTRRLSRFGDYSIDSIGGELAFAEPVPSFDGSLNPVFVRVSYDQERGGESHAVAGARVRFELTDSLVAGASFTDDAAPIAGGTLVGAYVTWQPRENTEISLGVARATHEDGRAPGEAQRLAVEHLWGGGRERRTSLIAGRAEEGFDSADSSIGAGREELRLEHVERLSPATSIALEASHSESLAVEELRRTYGATLERSLERWSLRAGARRIRQRDATADESFTTAIGGAERRFEIGGRAASTNVEYEQDVARRSRNRLALGATLQVHEHADVHARYERQDGLRDFSAFGTESASETFVLGAESDLIENTQLYSEYRLRGGIGGRDLATASGVRGNYALAPGLTLSPALEVIDTVAGDASADGVALSLGASDTRNPDVRISGQGEFRNGRSADYVGLRGSYAARLNLDWTAIVREDFRYQAPRSGERDLRHAFTLGLARRPRLDNRHHMLFQYQWKVERADGEASDRDVHVLSTHQNVQAGPRLVLAGRLGGKRQTTFLTDDGYDTAAYLADVRAIVDLDRRWSVDLRAGVLAAGRAGRSLRYAFGIGLSHVLDRNLELQLGYNLTGFRDEDLDPDGHDVRGVRFGLRYKFDEKAFGWLDERRGDDP